MDHVSHTVLKSVCIQSIEHSSLGYACKVSATLKYALHDAGGNMVVVQGGTWLWCKGGKWL